MSIHGLFIDILPDPRENQEQEVIKLIHSECFLVHYLYMYVYANLSTWVLSGAHCFIKTSLVCNAFEFIDCSDTHKPVEAVA